MPPMPMYSALDAQRLQRQGRTMFKHAPVSVVGPLEVDSVVMQPGGVRVEAPAGNYLITNGVDVWTVDPDFLADNYLEVPPGADRVVVALSPSRDTVPAPPRSAVREVWELYEALNALHLELPHAIVHDLRIKAKAALAAVAPGGTEVDIPPITLPPDSDIR